MFPAFSAGKCSSSNPTSAMRSCDTLFVLQARGQKIMSGAQPTAEGMGAPEQGPHMIKNTVPKNGREKTRKKTERCKKKKKKQK